MRRCVLSRTLVNEEVMARVGPQHHGEGGEGGQLAYYFEVLTVQLRLLHFSFPLILF